MMTLNDYLLRLGCAWLLGSLIGLERQWQKKSAGLRTNTLVALGACAYMLLSVMIVPRGGDPTRIAGQIVTGIGFLGAGVIMRHGFTVNGLNTAATLWCSGAVGCLAGAGYFSEAGIAAGAILLSHLLLRPLGDLVSSKSMIHSDEATRHYTITIKCAREAEKHIRALVMQYLDKQKRLFLQSLTSTDSAPADAIVTVEIISDGKHDELLEKITGMLSVEDQVSQVKWLVAEHESER